MTALAPDHAASVKAVITAARLLSYLDLPKLIDAAHCTSERCKSGDRLRERELESGGEGAWWEHQRGAS